MGSRPVSAPRSIKEPTEQSPKIKSAALPRRASAKRQSQRLWDWRGAGRARDNGPWDLGGEKQKERRKYRCFFLKENMKLEEEPAEQKDKKGPCPVLLRWLELSFRRQETRKSATPVLRVPRWRSWRISQLPWILVFISAKSDNSWD